MPFVPGGVVHFPEEACAGVPKVAPVSPASNISANGFVSLILHFLGSTAGTLPEKMDESSLEHIQSLLLQQ